MAVYRPNHEKTEPSVTETIQGNREAEERVLRRMDELSRRADIDGRWLAIARTDIEKGFMALNRAVAHPSRVSLPEDKGSSPEFNGDLEGELRIARERFNRTVQLEQMLYDVASGKRPLPTRDECRDWAKVLGVPDDVRAPKFPEKPHDPSGD